MLRLRLSALDHDITEAQIKEVLANIWGMTKWFKIHDDINENSQDMAVGFDAEGIPIEIGITYIEDDEVVFHANSMSSTWSDRYREE